MSEPILPDGVTVHDSEQGRTRTWKDADGGDLVRAILSWPGEPAEWAVIVCAPGDAVLVRVDAERVNHFAALWCNTVISVRDARAELRELRDELDATANLVVVPA